jgi:cell division protein FtsB
MPAKVSKKSLGLRIFFIINLLLLGFFSYNLLKEYGRNRQLDKEIKKLEATAKEIEAKNLDILNLAKYLDSEEFLEESARIKLGLKKSGEEAIVVTVPEEQKEAEKKEAVKELSNPALWWNYFFGKRSK